MGSCYSLPKLNKRVAVQAVSTVSDGQGGGTESWATETTVSAAIEPTKAWEKFQAGQFQTPATHKVTIRYLSGLTTKKRLLYGTRVMAIKEVIDVNEQHAFMELKVIEQQ